MRICKLCLLIAIGSILLGTESLAQDAQSAVVGICVVCHGEDGSAPEFADVPIIAGTPAEHIEEAIYSYQVARDAASMSRRCVRRSFR